MICLLDMDGVLVNFFGPFLQKFGVSLEAVLRKEKLPISGRLEDYVDGTGKSSFYNQWFAEDWEKLPKLSWADELIKFAEEKFGPDNVYLCTSAGYAGSQFYEEACIGKSRWVHQHLPDYTRRLVICMKKQVFAHPDAILIDDQTGNFVSFLSAGGKAVLFPAYYNSEYPVLGSSENPERVMSYVRQKVNSLTRTCCS